MEKEYLFDSGSDLGREQLDLLEILLDAPTTRFLEDAGVQPGWRCLDLGAGGGSVARWLAERAGPTGRVVAVDLDTDYLVAQAGVEVLQHDINDGVPPGGPFDLIHARLLLMHLPRREEILRQLVDALAPGGWLVVTDPSDRTLHVRSAPSGEDEKLFTRMIDTAVQVVARGVGVSYEWAHDADLHMVESGLVNISSLEHSFTAAGGTTACLLNSNYVVQMESGLLNAGMAEGELRRFHELMGDPRFRAWFFQFVFTRGQKPAA